MDKNERALRKQVHIHRMNEFERLAKLSLAQNISHIENELLNKIIDCISENSCLFCQKHFDSCNFKTQIEQERQVSLCTSA